MTQHGFCQDQAPASPPVEKKDAAPAEPAAPEAPAEKPSETGYLCTADVFYEWSTRPAAGEHGRGRTQEPAGLASQSETFESFYTQVEETGPLKLAAQALLESRRATVESHAMERCRAERQNMSGCVAVKLRNLGNDYERLDYAARGTLLRSVIGDCRDAQGICVKARFGTPYCREKPQVPSEKKDVKPGKAAQPEKK